MSLEEEIRNKIYACEVYETVIQLIISPIIEKKWQFCDTPYVTLSPIERASLLEAKYLNLMKNIRRLKAILTKHETLGKIFDENGRYPEGYLEIIRRVCVAYYMVRDECEDEKNSFAKG